MIYEYLNDIQKMLTSLQIKSIEIGFKINISKTKHISNVRQQANFMPQKNFYKISHWFILGNRFIFKQSKKSLIDINRRI